MKVGSAARLAAVTFNEENHRMSWNRIAIPARLILLIAGAGGLFVAWYLTRIGASGIEDVPPPFILVAGIVGLGCISLAGVGRYPRRSK